MSHITHAEVIKLLQDEIRTLNNLSTPTPNVVTEHFARENIAKAVKIHAAIDALKYAITPDAKEFERRHNDLLCAKIQRDMDYRELEVELLSKTKQLSAALAQPAEPLIVKGALTGVVDQVIKAAFPTAQPEPVKLTPCRCFDEVSKRLCLDKNKCVRIEAAAKGGV